MTRTKFPDLNTDDFIRIQEIQECMRIGTCRRYDPKTNKAYCVFFGVTHQRRRLDCSLRYDRTIDVTMGEEGIFSHKIPYYRCRSRMANGDGVIISE